MKIVELKAENIKKLKAIEVRPQGNTIVISGKNGAGKSSALDAIWFALTGKDSMKQTSKPVREGAQGAKVEIDIGDYVVTRRWTSNANSYLYVENKEGKEQNSPQTLLDSFIGDLSFDPLQFSRLDAKAQKKTLLKLLNIEEKLNEMDTEYQDIYNERTHIGKNFRAAKAQFEGMERPPIMEEVEETDISKLTQRLEEAIENNQAIEEMKRDIEENTERLGQIEEQIKKLESEREQVKFILKSSTRTLSEAKKIDTQGIQQKIAQAQTYRQVQEEANIYYSKKKEVEQLEKEVNAKTSELEKINQAKNEIIATSKMPIEGLGVEGDEVTYKGLPFAQLSAAEQLRVSLSIAMAANPKLKVIRIMDGSLLDSSNMKVIEELADGEDFQVWVERVDESGKVGIYIEDGQIVKNNYEKGE